MVGSEAGAVSGRREQTSPTLPKAESSCGIWILLHVGWEELEAVNGERVDLTCILISLCCRMGLPTWLSGKKPTCQCRRHWFDPWVWNISWRRKWQPTPVFLPRKNPMDRRAWQATVHGVKELDMAEHPRMLLCGGRLQGERRSRETPLWATAVQREMMDPGVFGRWNHHDLLIASMCEKDRTGGCREDTTEWLNNNKDKAGKRRVSMCREPLCMAQGLSQNCSPRSSKTTVQNLWLILTVYLLHARPSPWGSLILQCTLNQESSFYRKRKLREHGKIHTRTHDQ